ncbi:uncharacterized protein Z518_06867 [Rhinocladiella mackenziei CBS 650.93]|uniref:NmrA-like domain-containing protein n=1 Tax=Rhinocladiella mackenziei CBS 650.93 TaxID=1442369 RepID=A0A0D2J2W1_9EURO|nr:uncharacterized protein Z518_06867 [Rhinocladiella mackenziei CBS 650.93]KIX03315.1 hypothetical protein Z518_06867 [Rhinocladiella mackenziei CBS 650.93]
MAQYAKDQPAGFKNSVQNIAVVGAGGTVGKYVTEYLLKTGKHNVTAITRFDSTNKLPSGVVVQKVNYDEHSSLVSALTGQDVLIITLAVMAPRDTQTKLINAAADAGVPFIIPNEWGIDTNNESLAKETIVGERVAKIRAYISSLGKSSWITLVCSFWYEFSLGGSPSRYGFDIPNKSLVLFDDGNTKINTSTWDQCGRAVANLLSLKLLPEDSSDKSPTISQFRNKSVYISSFLLSQRDMLASVLRVTGDKESDWEITSESAKERYEKAMEELQKGDIQASVVVLYTRVFYRDGGGNYEGRIGLHNELLGLPTEDLDAATKMAIDMAMRGDLAY